MDTTKELNNEQIASIKMGDEIENLSKIRNPEVDTPIQPEEQLDIFKERENVKDEPHARMEVENDGQATIIAQDNESLCHTSLKINRKVTYRETKSGVNIILLRKCNKFRVSADCQKRKTMSSRRKALLEMTLKPFLQEDLSHEENYFQPESQNVQEDKSRILDGDLKAKNDSIGGFPTKSPFMNEALYQPVPRNRVLGYDNLSSSFLQSTYATDDEDENSGNADAGDTETKSDSIGEFFTKSPSTKVNPISANQFKEVSTSENKLSSFSQSSSVPLTTHDTTTESQSQKVKSPDEVWANFLSNLKTNRKSTDRAITDGATRQNVEASESKDDGFKDPTKRERDSTGKNLGSFVNAKTENVSTKFPSVVKNEISITQYGTGFIHPSENLLSRFPQSTSKPIKLHVTSMKSQSQKVRSAEEVWTHFRMHLTANMESFDRIFTGDARRENVETSESVYHSLQDPRKTSRDSARQSSGEIVNIKTENATTKLPSDVKNEISVTQYGTDFIHPYGNSLSRFSQSTSKPIKIPVTTMKSQSQKVRSAEEVWTHFRLHLTANMESFDRIFAVDARRENVETSESLYPNLKDPRKTARYSASSGELVKMKTENTTTEIQNDVKSERPRTCDVTPFIHVARAHFLNKILLYEQNLNRIQKNCQKESEMERKIKYLIDARDWGKKLDTYFKVLYDEKFIFNQAKEKLKSISPENNLSNATSLVDLPMSTRHIKSFYLLFLYLYRSLYCEVPVENIFEKINFENCLLVYKQFQEQKKIQEWARKESHNKASTLAVCFNASLDQCRLKFKHATLQFESNSLEDYQMLLDYLRISIGENFKCLKELISLGSSMVFPVMKYLSQSHRQLLKEFAFLDEIRPDVFTCRQNAG